MSLRWVESCGALAVIVREEADGALLIRYASRHGDYHTVSRASVTRRADLDALLPEPWWLQRARVSPRPPRALWPLLHDDTPRTPPPPMFDTDADGRPLS